MSGRASAGTDEKPAPLSRHGPSGKAETECGSEPVEDLVGPEALQALQRLVHQAEILRRDAADLLDRLDVAVVELVDDLRDLQARARSAKRAPSGGRRASAGGG